MERAVGEYIGTIIFYMFRPTDPQNINSQQKQNNTGPLCSKLQTSNTLEPCIEPENDNTNSIPTHLSPSLSTASSGYFPQNSYTSNSHSYYTTADDNHIDEAKTSEEGNYCMLILSEYIYTEI